MGTRNGCGVIIIGMLLIAGVLLGFSLIQGEANTLAGAQGINAGRTANQAAEGRGDSRTSAIAAVSNAGIEAPKPIYIPGIEFIQKKPDFGGETCIAMHLNALGHRVDQDDVFDSANLDPVLGRGCVTRELVGAAQRIGFETGQVWYPVNTDTELTTVWMQMLSDLSSNVPSVVCRRHRDAEQFVLVIGYNPKTDRLVFHNPNVSNGENENADRREFLRSCRLRNSSGPASSRGEENTSDSFVRIRLAGSRLKIQPSTERFTNADFAQHIRKLKTRLPNDDFRIVLQKPFVVVGDAGLSKVKRWASATVKWAVDSIKKDYFTKDPEHIIDVWLFKDAESYKKHNKILFNTEPNTPYGYYSPANRALVMDISTGGGTLVHEIVHPFVESNFSECPSWFNEGLASLYEQSSSRNGHIVGLTNWRLRGLQLALEDDRVPSFEKLCSTTRREFYDGKSTNYAQARYLCYYLQEKNLLIKFFHEFQKNVDRDPTGYETLQKVLERTDMEKFQEQWQAYVLKLRF